MTDPRSMSACPAARDVESWLDAQIGSSVGTSHRIVRHLVSGGMGHIFLGRDDACGEEVVVKLPLANSRQSSLMLRAESTILSTLRHRGIVRLLGSGLSSNGIDYLLLERLHGVELASWLDCNGCMGWPRASRVLNDLAGALDHVHVQGFVHGDVSPSNVMLDEPSADAAKWIDFGAARRYSPWDDSNMIYGTPGYMAPEHARGEACGPAADLYAFAALAFELLTGAAISDYFAAGWARTPPATKRRRDKLRRRAPRLEAVFVRALHTDPEGRFGSALAFMSALAWANETPSAPLVTGAPAL